MRKLILLFILSAVGSLLQAQTYTVNQTTGGVGTAGSFPWAVQQATAFGAGASIVFTVDEVNLGGATVDVNATGISVDGSTAPSGKVELFNGTNNAGLRIYGSTNTINDLVFADPVIISGGDDNELYGCFFGTDVTGNAATTNPRAGSTYALRLQSGATGNIIGGTGAGQGCVIAFYYNKVQIDGNSNNNRFVNCIVGGLGIDGDTEIDPQTIDNNENGFLINGSSGTIISQCVISNNEGHGVLLENAPSTNILNGTIIGLNKSGDTAKPNGDEAALFNFGLPQRYGVSANNGSHNLTISGAIISGNFGDGVNIKGSNNFTINGSKVGTDSTGMLPIGNTGNGIVVEGGTTHLVGGTTVAERNIVSANGVFDYRDVWFNGGVTEGNKAGHGIEFRNVSNGTGSFIIGNFVGLDATGNSFVTASNDTLGNDLNGIYVHTSNGVTVGGAGSSANYVGGNGFPFNNFGGSGGDSGRRHGIQVDGDDGGVANNNTVIGNYSGIGFDGTSAVGNAQDGISVFRNSSNNRVGSVSAPNYVSNNTWGIFVQINSDNNILEANSVIDNGSVFGGGGIAVTSGSENNRVGTFTSPDGGNIIEGNPVGLAIADWGADNSTANVSGTLVYNNLINANDGSGIIIQLGRISTVPLVTNSTIGGLDPNQANTITNNGGDGITMGSLNDDGDAPKATNVNIYGHTVIGNKIQCNAGRGINLNETANQGYGVTGPTEIAINNASTPGNYFGFAEPGATIDIYGLGTTCAVSCQNNRVQGWEHIDRVIANAQGEWISTVSASAITATATETPIGAASNTSEFAVCKSFCAPPTSVTLTPASSTICPGLSQELTATPTPATSVNGDYTFVFYAGSTEVQNGISDSYDASNAGTYTVRVVDGANIDDVNCYLESSTATLSLHEAPSATQIVPDVTVCSGYEETYSTDGLGTSSYDWTVTGGTPPSGSADMLDVTWGAGPSGNISVTETTDDNCVGSPISLPVSITSTPDITSISGADVVCADDIESYSVTAIPGATYTWNVSGGTATGSGNSRTITWGNGTSGSITVTVTANSCTDLTPVTLPVTINALPSTSDFSGDESVCDDATETYTVLSPNGTSTYTWTYTGGTPTSPQTGTSTDITWTSVGDHTLTLVEETDLGCVDPTGVSKTITVNALPDLTSAELSGPRAVCQDETYSYTASGETGSTYSWVVTGGTPAGPTVNNPLDITWTTSGAQSIEVTETTDASCSDPTPLVLSIQVNAAASITSITGEDVVCENSTETYTVVGGNPGSTYAWTSPNGETITGNGSDQVSVDWASVGGTLEVVETTSGTPACVSTTPVGLPITVSLTPTTTDISGDDTPTCNEAGVVYTVDAPSGTAGSRYEWSLPTDAVFDGPDDGNSVVVDFSDKNGDVKVQEFNADDCPGEIEIFPIDLVGCSLTSDFNFNTDTICVGESITFNSTSSGVSGTTTYDWTFEDGTPATASGTGLTDSHTITFNVPGEKQITLEINEAPSANSTTTKSIWVLPNPTQPTIDGTALVCENTSAESYSIQGGGNANSTYLWNVIGASQTAGGTTDQIDVNFGSTDATIEVIEEDQYGCSSVDAQLDVTVNVPPTTGTVTGPSSVNCSETGVTYTVSPFVSGNTFDWTVDGDASITDNNDGTASVDFGTQSSYEVTVTEISQPGDCPSNITSNFAINTVGCDLNAEFTISAPDICVGDTLVITNTTTGASATSVYDWDFGTDATPPTSADEGPEIKVVYSSSGTKTISLTVTEGITDTYTFNVQVNALPSKPDILGDIEVCEFATGELYTIASPTANDYNWTVNGATLSTGNGSDEISVNFGSSPAQIIVEEENSNACISEPDTLDVSIKPSLGFVSSIDGPTVDVCSGLAGQTYTFSVDPVTNATTYAWTTPPGSNILSGDNTNEIVVEFASTTRGSKTVSLVVSNDCGSQTRSYPMNVETGVTPSVSILGNTSTCDYETLSLSLFASGEGADPIYDWYVVSPDLQDTTEFFDQETLSLTPELKESGQRVFVELLSDAACISDDTVSSIPISINELITPQVYAGVDIELEDSKEIQLNGSQDNITTTVSEIPLVDYSWYSLDTSIKVVDSTSLRFAISTPTERVNGYVLEVSNNGSCPVRDTMYVYIDFPLIIPTGFTPNNDGENDVWEIWNITEFPNNRIEIYNRWGSLVWESTNYTNDEETAWKGFNSNGTELPIGTYYYVVTVNKDSDEKSYSGPVTIIK